MKKILFLLLVTVLLLACGASASAEFAFPQDLRIIEAEAFTNVPMGNYLEIPYGIEEIGPRAFAGTGLQVVTLPPTLSSIAPDAFDQGVAFDGFPKTYAKQWAEGNGFDFREINKPLLDHKAMHIYGQDAVETVRVNNSYTENMTFEWEKSLDADNWTVIEGATGPTLQIPCDPTAKDIMVRCRASLGDIKLEKSDLVFIYFHGDKTPFKEDKCRALSGDAVYLEWESMGENVVYTLLKRPSGSSTGQDGWSDVVQLNNKTNYTVYGLTADTSYDFKVVSYIKDGDEPLTLDGQELTLKTGTTATTFTAGASANGTALSVSWDALDGAVYDVAAVTDDEKRYDLGQGLTGQILNYYVLEPETAYTVQVTARIADSSQPDGFVTMAAPPVAVTTGGSAPIVEELRAVSAGDTARLSWKELEDTEYSVYMRKGSGEDKIVGKFKTTKCEIGGLESGIVYTFRVQASSGAWSSEFTEVKLTPPAKNPVEYRALLIGEGNHPGQLRLDSVYDDIELVGATVSNAKTPTGGTYSYVRRSDLLKQEILDAIAETFRYAEENDVSIFYISTHGDTTQGGKNAGEFSLVDKEGNTETMRMEELAAALSEVKGKVIVWLDCCGSGAAIYQTGVPQNGDEDFNPDPVNFEAFNAAAVEAFAAYDSAVDLNDVLYDGFAVEDTAAFETGEFRVEGKFYVMTAAAFQRTSASEKYGIFTAYLCEGIEHMRADANDDGELTQHELFMYVKYREENPARGQDVQVYPLNSDYVLFVK